MSLDIAALKRTNAARWAAMHIKADRLAEFDRTAHRLCAPENKVRFQGVTDRLGGLGYSPVPWWFIAICAEREYGGPPRWNKQLAQGDPLDQVSHNDPGGRGPFLDHPGDKTPGYDAWTRGCLDALVDCGPYAAKWTDWSIGGILTLWEEYNGVGYALRGVPSAYVFSGSDQYESGKFIADHVYSAGTKDVQEGCAPLFSRMMALDKSIVIGAPIIIPPAVKKEINTTTVIVTKPPDDGLPLWRRILQNLTTPIGEL